MTNDPHIYLSKQEMLRDFFFFLNPFIVPLRPSPMSDTIQTCSAAPVMQDDLCV